MRGVLLFAAGSVMLLLTAIGWHFTSRASFEEKIIAAILAEDKKLLASTIDFTALCPPLKDGLVAAAQNRNPVGGQWPANVITRACRAEIIPALLALRLSRAADIPPADFITSRTMSGGLFGFKVELQHPLQRGIWNLSITAHFRYGMQHGWHLVALDYPLLLVPHDESLLDEWIKRPPTPSGEQRI